MYIYVYICPKGLSQYNGQFTLSFLFHIVTWNQSLRLPRSGPPPSSPLLRCPWELRLAPGGGIAQPQTHFFSYPSHVATASFAARRGLRPLWRRLRRSSSSSISSGRPFGRHCGHLPADLRRRGPSHCCPSRPPRGISTAAGPQFVIPGRGSRGPVLISAGRLHPRVVDLLARGEQQPLPVWICHRRLLCRPLRRPVLRLRPPAVRASRLPRTPPVAAICRRSATLYGRRRRARRNRRRPCSSFRSSSSTSSRRAVRPLLCSASLVRLLIWDWIWSAVLLRTLLCWLAISLQIHLSGGICCSIPCRGSACKSAAADVLLPILPAAQDWSSAGILLCCLEAIGFLCPHAPQST